MMKSMKLQLNIDRLRYIHTHTVTHILCIVLVSMVEKNTLVLFDGNCNQEPKDPNRSKYMKVERSTYNNWLPDDAAEKGYFRPLKSFRNDGTKNGIFIYIDVATVIRTKITTTYTQNQTLFKQVCV